jgi:hypothetical protein
MNVVATPNRDPRFDNLLLPGSSEEIVISMDIGYTKVSTLWAVVNGREAVTIDSMTKANILQDNNPLGRAPARAVIFENDIMPAVGEKQYIMEFNGAADTRIQNKLAHARHVFYSLKQCLIPANSSLFERPSQGSSWYTRPLRRNASLLEKIVSSGKVKIVDVFTNQATLREFGSIQDILVELLRYQLQLTKKTIWEISGLDKNQVNQLMATRTRIGVSATTAFGNTPLDDLQYLLGEAGFPEKTTILSEAKSAAIYSVLRLKEQSETLRYGPGGAIDLHNRNFIVVDIGGGTTDVAVVKVLSTTPSQKLREVQPVTACMNGSEALNDIAATCVLQHFGRAWVSEVLNGFNLKEERLLQYIRTRFRTVKKNFDPLDSSSRNQAIFPEEIERVLRPYYNYLNFTVELVQKIFETWLGDIVRLVRQQRSLLEAHAEGAEEVPIILTGLGSSPRFIEQHMRAMIGTTVLTINPNMCSSVAFGGYLSMLDRDLFQQAIARFSYGIIKQRNTAQGDGRLHLTEEPEWLIKKGDALSSTNVLSYDGVLHIENPKFPLHIVQKIIKSTDATIHEREFLNLEAEIDRGTIIQEDTLDLEVTQQVSGLERKTRRDGTSFIETQFKLEIAFTGPQCKCTMFVPKDGKFTTAGWREEDTLMTHECYIHDIWSHTAQRND